MAAGIRSLLAFWLGGAAAGTTLPPPPPPPPPVEAEPLSGGWRLTDEQIARLRGARAADRRLCEDVQTAPEVEHVETPAEARAPLGHFEAPVETETASLALGATVQALAEADLSRRQVLEAQAREEEEALVLMLALLEDL